MSGPGSGFRVEALREALARGGGLIGRRLEYHPAIGSTNDRARELAAAGEPEGTVVLAGEQTGGRGRGTRGWHSPAGVGLYLSVVLRPEGPASRAPMLGLLGAVAGARALGCRIKWPNDLLLDGLKAGGVLAEARTSAETIRDAVVGIGVNVDHEDADFPPGLRRSATSLRMARGAPQDRGAVALAILEELDAWYTVWRREGGGAILAPYRELAVDLDGRRVRVMDGADSWTGTTVGLGESGELRVRRDGTGEVAAIRFGEVARVEGA